MINVRELMNDPDFSTKYVVLRSKGTWVKGRFVPASPERLKYFGPVQPATEKELQQLPEGDQQREIRKFMCASPKQIHITQDFTSGGTNEFTVSDQIIYKKFLYKIIKVKDWDDNGYMRAFGYKVGVAPDG